MHAALRPYVTASVALVGASVIAVTPVAPTPLEIPVASPAVELTAAPKPLDFYGQVLEAAIVNVVDLVSQNKQTASYLLDLAREEPGLLLRTVAKDLLPLVLVAAQTLVNPLFNTLGATAVAVRDIVQAVLNLDPPDLVNAIVDVPARIADGFLNGGYTASWGGFLSPFNAITAGPFGFPTFALFVISGDLGGARTNIDRRGRVRQLSSIPSSPINESPTPDAATVMLDATASVETDSTPADPGLDKAQSSPDQEAEQNLQAEQAESVAEASDTADAETTPTETATAPPDQGLRTYQAKHPLLDKLRQRVAERKARPDGESPGVTKHVRAIRSDN